ncbi:hypothetical protein FGO68_gene2027 [Halteria grandinella]|uniref:histidine kinase n=1 Tax=Halteria grandinella TaxID=5974 RepID=A0A8J8P3G8_HALGN|nr:hypothetical protein FGO68_gene2027 [Halteria grandinella]
MNNDLGGETYYSLWRFINDQAFAQHTQAKGLDESVYKAKAPLKKYLQVKTQFINDESQMLVICSDITKLKEVDIQGQKMRATFFSSVAHELRTPLNSIIPILRLLMAQFLKIKNLIPGADRVSNLISLVLNAALHLESVIEDALDLSRIENNKFALHKENFNVHEAVEEVCDIMRFQIESKGLRLNVQISDQTPAVIFSDKKRFKQVLFNLIGNAIKFTYKGGIKVEVSLKKNQSRNDSDLIVSIIDSGIGISQEDDHSRIWRTHQCDVHSRCGKQLHSGHSARIGKGTYVCKD